MQDKFVERLLKSIPQIKKKIREIKNFTSAIPPVTNRTDSQIDKAKEHMNYLEKLKFTNWNNLHLSIDRVPFTNDYINELQEKLREFIDPVKPSK